jgi:hypothetical protein
MVVTSRKAAELMADYCRRWSFLIVGLQVYWMHRTLHENKFLYKYIHALHHKYNKPSTLSPWASVAFNPIDGILQVRWSADHPHCHPGLARRHSAPAPCVR